jgi:jumonji domain-containing protein 7
VDTDSGEEVAAGAAQRGQGIDWYRVTRDDEDFDWEKTKAAQMLLKERWGGKEIWNTISSRARTYNPQEDLVRLKNPDPVDFYIDYVSKGIPCIIEGLLDSSFAKSGWTEAYLRAQMADREVTVCVTPSGTVDEVYRDMLMRPMTAPMRFTDFLNYTSDSKKKRKIPGKFYVQDQANNLVTDFQPLLKDMPHFGGNHRYEKGELGARLTLKATNLWMGEKGCRSSLHFDFYENLNCLISGRKSWVLYPPTDLPFLYLNYYKEAAWDWREPDAHAKAAGGKGQWTALTPPGDADADKFPWLSVDPFLPDEAEHPRAENAEPIYYEQRPGETLFIPATWHHATHITQAPTAGTSIAVNYWYDVHSKAVETNFAIMAFADKFMREHER